jgi:hypothetical protein|nr:MAG TPA: hypothetical protein [Caudoviricetes sp.]
MKNNIVPFNNAALGCSVYGYVIYKPDGGQIIVSGTTRITRTKVKNNNEL